MFIPLKAIEESRLFVLYHEDYDNIPRLVINNPFDDQKELEKMTPVSLFILNGQNDLQVVAIQINDTEGKHIFLNKILKIHVIFL